MVTCPFVSTPRILENYMHVPDLTNDEFYRHESNLATLGSIMMVLSVVVGTLTQQAIQTVPCQKASSNGIASVPIAQTSLKGIEANSGSGSGKTYLLAKDLKASLIAGFAGARQPNSFSPTCPSGNCGFQASDGFSYTTVGISSECIDVSSLISQSGLGLEAWTSNQDYSNLDRDPVTNYSLPNGLTLSYRLGPGRFGFEGGRWKSVLAQAQLYHPDDIGLSPQNITLTDLQRHLIFETPSIDGILLFMPTINPCQTPSDYKNYFDVYEATAMPAIKTSSCPELELPGVDTLPGYFSVTAAACFFYPSLQQYESSIVNGALEEKALGDSNPIDRFYEHLLDDTTGMYWLCTMLEPCVVDGVVYTNTSANLSSVPGGTTVVGNITVPWRCLYGFDYPWYRALKAFDGLCKTFSDSVIDNACTQSGNYTSMVCSGTWWFNDIFNVGNASIASISEFMKRGFDSLSSQLRMMGTDWEGNPTNVSGIAYDNVVCVVFRWQWLFYPLFLVVGSSVLLLLLLISGSGTARSRKKVIWKTSVLPFLFYGLEDYLRDQDSKLATQEDLNGAAKALSASFSLGGDGWRFHN